MHGFLWGLSSCGIPAEIRRGPQGTGPSPDHHLRETQGRKALCHLTTQSESGMPSAHPILCRPLLLLPSIFPGIRVSSSESALCIRWPKDWSFGFSISRSSECSGVISFRMDRLDLLDLLLAQLFLRQANTDEAFLVICLKRCPNFAFTFFFFRR